VSSFTGLRGWRRRRTLAAGRAHESYLGVESVIRIGNRAAEGRIRLQLGFACYNQDDIEQALVGNRPATIARALPGSKGRLSV